MPLLKESIQALRTTSSDSKASSAVDNTPLDLNSDHAAHVVYGGTKIIIHTKPKSYNATVRQITPPANHGCVGYVLKTGFHSGQGKLVRTILFSTERVSMNNTEALLFIGVLLIFALIASGYVLYQGLQDESRDKWKLVLNCIMILTSNNPNNSSNIQSLLSSSFFNSPIPHIMYIY